jgi:hypothetical protein
MNPPPTAVRSWLALLAAGALLGLTAGYGLLSGLTEAGAESWGQRTATWAELGYGALAAAGLVSLLWPRVRGGVWARRILYAWAVLLVVTIPLGSVVWGGAGAGPAVGLGVAAAVVAGLVLWLTGRAT